MLGKYRALLRRRDYLILLTGNTISRFGDEILYLALLAKVYELTGSALGVGLVTVLDILPGIVISPFAGFWIDRLNRKRIMIAAVLFNGLVVLGLVWAQELWQIYLAMFLIASGAAIFHPANSSLEPNLLSKGQYMLANSLKMTVNNLQRVLGPAAGERSSASSGSTRRSSPMPRPSASPRWRSCSSAISGTLSAMSVTRGNLARKRGRSLKRSRRGSGCSGPRPHCALSSLSMAW